MPSKYSPKDFSQIVEVWKETHALCQKVSENNPVLSIYGISENQPCDLAGHDSTANLPFCFLKGGK
jgi:hypothetical protein